MRLAVNIAPSKSYTIYGSYPETTLSARL